MPRRTIVFLVALIAALTAPPAPAAAERWTWPLTGTPRVLKRFAPPPAPWLAGHRGIDLAARPGAQVLAAGPGTIGYAAPLAGRGVVTIHHPNGLRTTYLPVHPSVRRGQPIDTGTPLGTLEPTTTPHCPESCLHWGLLRDRRYLDPLLLIGTGLIRLLPHWPPPAIHQILRPPAAAQTPALPPSTQPPPWPPPAQPPALPPSTQPPPWPPFTRLPSWLSSAPIALPFIPPHP